MSTKDENEHLSDSYESKALSSTVSSPSSPSDFSFTGDENEDPSPVKSDLPVEPPNDDDEEDDKPEHQSPVGARSPPRVSHIKRLMLFVIIAALVWLFFPRREKKQTVIYANRCVFLLHSLQYLNPRTRYSKEFKYRPAASPIITETLKDGRIRLRGAAPTTLVTPTPTPTPAPTKRKRNKRKIDGKTKSGTRKSKSKRNKEKAKRGTAAK